MFGRRIPKIFFYVLAALYPFLIFTLLVVFHLPVRVLSLCVIVLGSAFFLSATGKSKKGDDKASLLDWRPLLTSSLLIAAGLFCFFTQEKAFLKLYSVAVSLVFLLAFGGTLLFPPSMAFRFACVADRSIPGSFCEPKIKRYCRKVTTIWCAFFVLNGSVSIVTVFFASDRVWTVYNGGISYVLIGLLFTVEFLVRKVVMKRMIKAFPITKFSSDSRKDSDILCFDGFWSKGNYKTWFDFLCETAKMRIFLSEHSSVKEWILHCEDYWNFLVIFVALLQCEKKVLLTQNISESFIAEIKTAEREFLTDQKVSSVYNAFFIPDLLSSLPSPSEKEIRFTPKIDACATEILMFTSGSTGKSKAVPQRMKEFEEDNAFIISKWGKEFTSRNLISTVSQHHIYGFLFSISLPFALGVPFRRKRIEFPEEIEILSDSEYMIISTPAFLKRACDMKEDGVFPLKNPWIFTSGGEVSPELSSKTEKVFGFCPLEVYGSTETSGIAFRQQNKDGLEWTPFDNAKIWVGDDGCLRIISPYIKDPEGFATADLASLLPNGKFLLKGRSDSIVKIEEKRISLTEVEARLLSSGLISDVKVVAMTNEVRQFLAAVIVLNDEGLSFFAGKEKYDMNKHFHDFLLKYFENVVIPKKWRFIEAFPTDSQGKKRKEDIIAMFEKEDD